MTLRRVVASNLTPESMRRPPINVVWYPLDSGASVTAGLTSPSGLLANAQTDGTSIATNAVLAVNASGATWNPAGGLTHTAGSAAFWDITPTGGDLTFLQNMLDLSNFAEGETLLCGFELIAPADWTTASATNEHTTSNVCLCIGDLSSGNGGYSFEISGVERPQITFWGQGATAQAAVLSTTASNFLRAGGRNVVVFELIRTATAKTFTVKAHVVSHDEGYSQTAYTTARDFSDPTNGGTDAPGCGTAGLRIARRRSANTAQTNRGETLRNLWLARFPSQMYSAPKRVALEMFAYPNRLPPGLRRFSGDSTVYQGPDGNADKAFGDVDIADMFVYADGSTSFADTPEMTLEVEQPVTPSVSKLSQIESHQQYFDDTSVEGLLRLNPALGGDYKFARFKTGPWANTLLFSGHKLDTSNRGRAECTWQGPAVTMPLGVTFWMALRVYFDFSEPEVGQLVFMQLFPGYSDGGLFPMWTMEIDTTNKRFNCKFGWSDSPNTLQTDIVREDVTPTGYDASLYGQWHDFVVQHRVHWDAAESPFTKVWMDDDLILDRAEPYGYRGPSGLTGKSVEPFMRCGIYPPSPTLTPNTTRDVRVARFFVCKNSGSYSLATIRAALVA